MRDLNPDTMSDAAAEPESVESANLTNESMRPMPDPPTEEMPPEQEDAPSEPVLPSPVFRDFPADQPPESESVASRDQADDPAQVEETKPEEESEAMDDAKHEEEPEQVKQPEISQQSEVAAKSAYWRSVLTGDPATVPSGVREKAGADEWEMSEEQREYRLLGTINRSWAADHLPYSRESLSSRWKQQRRELTGQLGVRDNEHELFLALSEQQADAPRRAAASHIYELCYMAGLDGADQADYTSYLSDLSEQDAQHAAQLAAEAYAAGQDVRHRYEGLADVVVRGIDAFASVEEDAVSAPRVVAAAPHLLEAVDTLADMSETDRNTVLYLAAEQVRKQHINMAQRGLWERVQHAMRRGAANISVGIAQGISNMGIATLSHLGSRFKSEGLQNAATGWDKRMRVFDELRHLSQDELRPLVRPAETESVASYLITAAEAVPAATLSCCGGAGFSVLILDSVGDAVAEARRRAPMASQELQLYAGLLGGTIQAGIYMNLNRVGGKLLEQTLSRIGRAGGHGIAGYTLAGLNVMGSTAAEAAKMLTAGKLAQAADLGSQELAARLSGTASNINWQEFGSNLTEVETNMHEAAAMLPFLLIGSGRLALQHFRAPRAILGEGHFLADWGIPEEKRAAIMDENRIDVQSELLRDALVTSPVWRDLGSYREVSRALSLLNQDSCKVFSNCESVRDFLKLSYSPPEPLKNMPITDRGAQMSEALSLWKEWWQNAGLKRLPAKISPENFSSLSKTKAATASKHIVESIVNSVKMPSPLPERLRELGLFAPRAEEQRRAILDERIKDVEQLSYLFLLSMHSVDELARGKITGADMRAKAELTRKRLIGALTRAVASTAAGVSHAEALGSLSNYVKEYFRRVKYRSGSRTDLVVQNPFRRLTDISRQNETLPPIEPEIPSKQVAMMNVVSGLRANAGILMELLPRTSDFQTALTRGLSPREAYTTILRQQFGLEKDPSFPSVSESMQNITPMEDYSKRNAELFETYQLLTGRKVDVQKGEDNQEYCRSMRPNGSYTSWHLESAHAVNDVAGNAALGFMPLTGAGDMLTRLPVKDGQFSLMELSSAPDWQFSTYDQMCGAAMRDLGKLWMEDISNLQPGYTLHKPRKFVRSTYGTDGVSPIFSKEGLEGGNYDVDWYSHATPLSMAQARFFVYWHRMFNSEFISPDESVDYLVNVGFLKPEDKQSIIAHLNRPVFHWPKGVKDMRAHMRKLRADEYKQTVAEKMSEFTLLRFLSQLDELPVPDSVREWVAMAPFCPEPQNDLPARAAQTKRGVVGTHESFISWANKAAAKKLRVLAPQVHSARLKNQTAPTGTQHIIDTLMPDAMGSTTWRSYEQSWMNQYAGQSVMCSTPQTYWNLLYSPRKGWSLLDEGMRRSLRKYLLPLCSRETFYYQDAASGQDAVESALNMLDDTLRDYPTLHQFSLLNRRSQNSIHTLRFDHDWLSYRSANPGDYADIGPTPLPIYSPNTISSSYEQLMDRPMPKNWLADRRVVPSLMLLDELRSYPKSFPHVYRGDIWWNGKRYGNGGKRPDGLEKYVEMRPLTPIIEMLQHISEQSGDKPMNICGVQVHGLPRGVDLRALDEVTVYRAPKDPTSVYRLMPGDPELASEGMRTPYLVHCRKGIYLNESAVVRQADGMQEVFVPLHKFHPHKRNAYSEARGSMWAEVAALHNIHQAVGYGMRMESLPEHMRKPAYLLEFLMRVAEDSGFSAAIDGYDPRTLSMGQAQVLRLSSDLISALCAPDPEPALARLVKYAHEYRQDTESRRPIINTLYGSNEAISGKKLLRPLMRGIMKEQMQKAVDELDAQTKKSADNTEEE